MMSFVERLARDRGYKTLVIRAADPIPVRFYQKLGYRLLLGGGTLDPEKIEDSDLCEVHHFSKDL